jgi:putative ABC transport system substrate-binding protein
MKRREVLVAAAATAACLSAAAYAQSNSQVRRIGYLSGNSGSDAAIQFRLTIFREALQKLGWIDGRNVRIEARFGESDPARLTEQARSLVSSGAEIIVAQSNPAVAALRAANARMPVVQ